MSVHFPIAAVEPTLVPKTPRQRELYDIMMQLYESKMTALETKRRITEWFSKHAVGTSLKDKQVILITFHLSISPRDVLSSVNQSY